MIYHYIGAKIDGIIDGNYVFSRNEATGFFWLYDVDADRDVWSGYDSDYYDSMTGYDKLELAKCHYE